MSQYTESNTELLQYYTKESLKRCGRKLELSYRLEEFLQRRKEKGKEQELDDSANEVPELKEKPYKPDFEKGEVDRLIDDVRMVRRWHVEEARAAHRKWYGDDRSRPFEEPPAHVFRMGPGDYSKRNEPGYFAGDAGVGLRLHMVAKQANKGRGTRSQWYSTLDQRKALAVAMGYEANVEWWNFSREPDGKATSRDFEDCVWGAWWWRRICVGEKYRSWKKGGGEGEFREPDPCLPPKANMKLSGKDTNKAATGNDAKVTVHAFSKHKNNGRLTDEQSVRLAWALGDKKYEWWKENEKKRKNGV